MFTAPGNSSLGSGCIGTQDASTTTSETTSSATQSGTDENAAAGSAESALLSSSNNSSASASVPQSSLTASELQLLQSALAGLVPGSAAGASSAALSGTPSLSDLKKLGFHKRDIAILALDLAAQQTNLTPEQSFALRLTKALVGRDTNALAQLLIEQLLPAASSGSSASASQGTTP
jgi:hypothetical protein